MEKRRTVQVAFAGGLDRLPAQLDRAQGGGCFAGELSRPGAQLGEVEPGELGRVRHRVPERERPFEVGISLGQAEDGLRLASCLDRRRERLSRSTRSRPVRCELRRCRGSAERELFCEPRVQLLALPREDGRVDGLREQGVPEAEDPRLRLGHEDAVLDRLAQRLAHVALRKLADGAEQRVLDVASGGCRNAQQALRWAVEPGHALQQQVAQATRELAVLVGGSEELLGEERVAFRAGGDRVRQRRWRCGARVSCEQRRQFVVSQRPELEQERRTRAPDAVDEPEHALGRCGVVRAVGGEQQHPPGVEVVREEDDEIERRGVSPMQILEHEQDGCGLGALGEQRQRLLEGLQLGGWRRPIDVRRLPERTQSVGERLVRQLRPDEVDRATEEHLGPGGAGATCELGGEPRLADARFPGDEDDRAAPGACRIERALELPELAYASDEYLARASHHSSQYRAPPCAAGRAA